jgi:uncharacterized lipoprotein NlpE involved in copper resistance
VKKIFALMMVLSLAAIGCDDKKSSTKPAGTKVEETKKTTDTKDGKTVETTEKKTTENKTEVKPAEKTEVRPVETPKGDTPKLPDPPKK